jgi:hypothetical protein
MKMNPKVRDLQLWLNSKGANLNPDGVGGKLTRQAILDVFRYRWADAVTTQAIHKFADRLGGSVAQMRAVSEVEAPRGGWDNTGLLVALYERHYGWKRWQILLPLLSNPKPGGYTIDVDNDGINDSWEKVADAACRFGMEAFECASWGKFQIMGAWWKKLGYASVLDFVYGMTRDETAHYEAMVRYIERFGLKAAFQKISGRPADCVDFAKGYNGPRYAKNQYDVKIASAFRRNQWLNA